MYLYIHVYVFDFHIPPKVFFYICVIWHINYICYKSFEFLKTGILSHDWILTDTPLIMLYIPYQRDSPNNQAFDLPRSKHNPLECSLTDITKCRSWSLVLSCNGQLPFGKKYRSKTLPVYSYPELFMFIISHRFAPK